MASSKTVDDQTETPLAVMALTKAHHVYCSLPAGHQTTDENQAASIHDFLIGLGVACNDILKRDVKVTLALYFRGYDHCKVGTAVVCLDHFYSAWDCLRMDFDHPDGMDETFGVCINFWDGFAIAFAPIDNYEGEIMAVADPDGTRFVEIVQKYGRPNQ